MFKNKNLIAALALGVVVSTASASAACFTTNLSLGKTHAQVKTLQEVLNDNGFEITASGSGSAGNETTYFGAKTKIAVQKFQKSNSLPATGNVFALTRAALNDLCEGVDTPANPGSTTPVTPKNPTTGTSTTPVTSGSVSVSLAANQPVNNVLISGAARSNLANFSFTGTGVVTSIVLQRLGISDNNTLGNVYLYDASTGLRLTDSASVLQNGSVTFNNASGLFAVSGTSNVLVVADINQNGTNGNSTSGQSVGFSLASFSVKGATAPAVVSSVSGPVLPIGNLELAKAYFNNTTSGPSQQINAGTLGSTIWTNSLQIGTRVVNFTGATFKMIGSAPSNALANVKLFVDGIQYGNASSVDQNGRVTFTGNSIPLNTGSHTIDIRADIVSGSNRNFYVTLENAGDIGLADSSVNANVTLKVGSNSGSTLFNLSSGQVTINSGSLIVTQNPNFTVSSVVGGATNQTIASFKVTSYGEDVKILNLPIKITGYVGSLNNVYYTLNGGAITSATNLTVTAGTIIDYNPNLGSSLIVSANGSSSIIEVKADLQTSNGVNITAGNIGANIVAGTLNVQGISSYALSNLSGATGQSLSVNSGNVSFGATSGFGASNISKNQSGVKIGSFSLQAGSSESVQVSNINVSFDAVTTATLSTEFTNLKVTDGQQTIIPTPSNNFSVNYNIAQGQTKVIEVWVDTLDIIAGKIIAPKLSVSYRGLTSNTNTVTTVATAPNATAATISLSDPKKVESGTLGTRAIPGGKKVDNVVTYNVVTTNGNSTIVDLNFIASSSIQSLSINGVSASNVGGNVNFYGINLPVSVGPAGRDIPVSVTYANVTQSGQGGVTSGTSANLALTGLKINAGGVISTPTFTAISGNAIKLTASVPTVSVNSNQTTGLILGQENKVGEVTISADAAGQVRVITIGFNLGSSGITLPVFSGVRIADGNTTISGSSCTNVGVCTLGNYVLSAGASKTFNLYANVAGTAQASTNVSVSASVNSFAWDDNTGGSPLSISDINNFPTNSYSIRQ